MHTGPERRQPIKRFLFDFNCVIRHENLIRVIYYIIDTTRLAIFPLQSCFKVGILVISIDHQKMVLQTKTKSFINLIHFAVKVTKISINITVTNHRCLCIDLLIITIIFIVLEGHLVVLFPSDSLTRSESK